MSEEGETYVYYTGWRFFVIFHPYKENLNDSMKIEIDGKTISQHKSVKYMGIVIDCHLNGKEQTKLQKNNWRYWRFFVK